MSRAIKFRVLDKAKNVYLPDKDRGTMIVGSDGQVGLQEAYIGGTGPDGRWGFCSHNRPYAAHEVVVEMWTGLVDRTGREIYEGDIVIYETHSVDGKTHGWTPWTSVVEWGNEGINGFWLRKLDGEPLDIKERVMAPGVSWMTTWLRDGKAMEIVGNVHQAVENLRL